MNSNAAWAFRCALATEWLPSSQGRRAVPEPKGSDSGLLNVCQ